MRVVGGKWKGQPIEAPNGRDVTRPTTDRVREAMASMVLSAFSLDLSGVRVLDAFAGSGALGIEMLSRGADFAAFVDSDRGSVARIRRNLSKLAGSSSASKVVQGDAFKLAASGALAGGPFSLVMLDPPYALAVDEVARLVSALGERGLLERGAHVLYERKSSSPQLELEGATMVKQKRFGDTSVDYLKLK